MISFLYIGSNDSFAKSLINQQEESSEEIEILYINTRKKSIVDVIDELKSDSIEFESYIIQLECVFKDKKTLGESHGLELIKHILLTESLGEKRNRKIIALSFYNLHYLIKQNPDNIILNAPSISLMNFILSPKEMLKNILKEYTSYKIEFIKEREDFDRNLLNYIVITEEERVKESFSDRDFFGLQRLYREFYCLTQSSAYPQNYEERIRALVAENPLFEEDSNKLLHKKLTLKHKVSSLPLQSSDVIKPLEINPLIVDSKTYWRGFFEQVFGQIKFLSTDFNGLSVDNQDVWKDLLEYEITIKNAYVTELESFLENIQTGGDGRYTARGVEGGKINFVFLELRLLKGDYSNKNHNDLSGIKLLRKIRGINSLLPVCIFTASEDPISIRYSFKYGCNAYFCKGQDSLYSLYGLIHSNMTDWSHNNAIGELLFILRCKEMKVPKLISKSLDFIRYRGQEECALYIEEMTETERNTLIGRIDEVLHKMQKNNMEIKQSVESENLKLFLEIRDILYESLGIPLEKGHLFDFSFQSILQKIEAEFKQTTSTRLNISKRGIRFNSIVKDFIDYSQLYDAYKPFTVKIESDDEEMIKVSLDNTPINPNLDLHYFIEKSQMKKVCLDIDFSKMIKEHKAVRVVKRKKYDCGECTTNSCVQEGVLSKKNIPNNNIVDFYDFPEL